MRVPAGKADTARLNTQVQETCFRILHVPIGQERLSLPEIAFGSCTAAIRCLYSIRSKSKEYHPC